MSSRLVSGYVRVRRMNRPYVTAEGARDHLRERTLRPQPYGPPRRLRADVTVSVRRPHEWPVYTLTPNGGRPRGCVVYAHGGGWVNEIVSQHWRLAAQIAAEAATTVLLPIYPLIPYGTAGEVVGRVADLVLAGREEHGAACLAGDSAGGQIALSTAVFLRDHHQVTLPRTVLISPALDLTFANPRIDAVQPSDPWLGRAGGRVFAEHWRGDLPITDPRVSPLNADLRGLGPVTMFCGTRDILNPDAHLLAGKAAEAGVDLEFHEAPGLVHVYPLTPTPEGKAARAVIVDRLRAAPPSA
ncbi:alpha/beta hydrolase fold domain-containing protein [Actinoallomurus rhizosphaericola]|uniref:alpha/beta hydrolase fold domain-containing protein n=1 Tax=Actinoallomurus rhizosphaericola TaxID=2952536 RepID=UPI002093D6F0|nr:alpha/beta hydrolase [Actinoallomurus rhizosphaericola]MCO6000241.1 alpha/beta hydrolase [Actinoallomurus rhizosphaericola]